MIMKTILIIVSALILLLAAFGVAFSHVLLLPLGLAIFVAAQLVP